MQKIILSVIFLSFIFPSYSQLYKDLSAPVEERVNSLLKGMTMEEKLNYIGGVDHLYIRPIERLGLPKIKMSDGPVGVRSYGNAVAYPSTILTAASWDTALARKMGTALGKDARARGVHILLAPGVNIFRASMNGRNFEYLGEDPYLASRMAVSYINGVQQQGVVATIKHYAANNQEWNRHHVSSDMDERTLHEIYLPAFKAAVREAKVGAVMNSYNLINGVHATQNGYLNKDVLKKDWGFDGILMSDWESVYDGVEAAKNGLDLEMPFAKFMNKDTLMPALASGVVKEADIDDKVRRILRIIFRFGFYDKEQLDKSIPENNPVNDRVALEVARGGMVLLKNQQNILPLNATKARTIAVIGPNADAYVAGGGSSHPTPFHSTTVLQAVRAIAPGSKILYAPGFQSMEGSTRRSVFYTAPGSAERGLKASYFDNIELKGEPAASRIDSFVDNHWAEDPGVGGLKANNFSVRWTGVIRPATTSKYRFTVRGDDGYRLWVNKDKIIDDWNDHAATIQNADILLEAGKEYSIKLEFFENGGAADISLAWYLPVFEFAEAQAAAAKADVVIVCVGFNEILEHEGGDRTFALPFLQDSLINAIAAVNKNIVVVLNGGGNVDMRSWLKNARGLLHAWFPGQEGGTAVAEILFGKINPSGKLPVSFEKEWKDNPVFNNYHDADGDKRVAYKEGLSVGYRYWDKSAVKPQFPFGFGLSYTKFSYSNLKITNTGKPGAPSYTASFDIKNTGNHDGAEVGQLYVHEQDPSQSRPLKELKGFTKIYLKKGETGKGIIKLDANAFSFYKGQAGFDYDPGMFDILIGASSADIKLKQSIKVE